MVQSSFFFFSSCFVVSSVSCRGTTTTQRVADRGQSKLIQLSRLMELIPGPTSMTTPTARPRDYTHTFLRTTAPRPPPPIPAHKPHQRPMHHGSPDRPLRHAPPPPPPLLPSRHSRPHRIPRRTVRPRSLHENKSITISSRGARYPRVYRHSGRSTECPWTLLRSLQLSFERAAVTT